MTKQKKTPIGQITTAQLVEMPALPSVEKEGWTLRYDQDGVRLWLNTATGDCCMDTRTDGRWTRKTEWFGGVPDLETKPA